MVSPQDTPKVIRELHGDPNDQKVIKEIKDIRSKPFPDFKMNGTYLITDLQQEAAVAKIIISNINSMLLNKNNQQSQIKFGVSAMKPELFMSLTLIVESIEN